MPAGRDCAVILAPAEDVHAIAVSRVFERKYPDRSIFIVDTADFPARLRLSLRPEGWSLASEDWQIDSSRVSGLWHRRPYPPVPADAVRDAGTKRFVIQESGLAIDLLSASDEYRVVNRLDRHFLANRKPFQLHVARQCGLTIPDYDITNDPARAAALLTAHGDNAYIFKTLGPPVHVIGETRYLHHGHRDQIDQLQLAPVIFQRAIPRRAEYRVVYVGGRLFAHEILIHNQTVHGLPDWRLDLAAECRSCALPVEVETGIHRLMRRLDLSYGAIDFIEDDQGVFYFLEVNPQGQFLFSEIDAGTPISEAMADLLAGELDVSHA